MKQIAISCILLVLLAVAPLAGKQPGSSNFRMLTGYVDERPGAVYVLLDETTGQEVVLEAGGFANESLAKYLGHRVKARGRIESRDGSRRMRVSAIQWAGLEPGAVEESISTDNSPYTLAGVIQRGPGGRYVLRSQNSSFVIADLKPGAAGSAALDAYEGQSVTVEGELVSGVGTPVLTVHSVSPFTPPAR
jgi:hypothetical protein